MVRLKLYEYQAKKILSQNGIPIPKGEVASKIEEIVELWKKLGPDVVLKAQVRVAGRGKAGGIIKVSTMDEAINVAKKLLGSTIKGEKVYKLLVEKGVNVKSELYLAVVLDRSERCFTILGSKMGGVEIEELAKRHPGAVFRIRIPPLEGLMPHHVRALRKKIGLNEDLSETYVDIACKLYDVALKYECTLVEINPLALTMENKLIALDSKMILDNNALYRTEVLLSQHSVKLDVSKRNFNYVRLEGDIGVIGNGAGLTMATMDLISYFGGKPGCFLDIGGGASAERVREALTLLDGEGFKTVFMNILGGITRCDEVARGIVEAKKSLGIKNLVIRLSGTNELEGRMILKKAGIPVYSNMEDAAEKAVQLGG